MKYKKVDAKRETNKIKKYNKNETNEQIKR